MGAASVAACSWGSLGQPVLPNGTTSCTCCPAAAQLVMRLEGGGFRCACRLDACRLLPRTAAQQDAFQEGQVRWGWAEALGVFGPGSTSKARMACRRLQAAGVVIILEA